MLKMKKKHRIAMASLVSLACAISLAACASPKQSASDTPEAVPMVDPRAPVTESTATGETPGEADEFGVIPAAAWSKVYPNQYESYMLNSQNSPDSGKHDYLELYKPMKSMYAGYAFALGYDEASSHVFTLDSVSKTPRTTQKEQLANCITCKSPQFTALVNKEGVGVYSQKFNDLIDEFDEPVSCYNCHENDPETLTLTHGYWIESLGGDRTDLKRAPLESQVCGQCHNEYYFDAETKATSNPYTGIDDMTPDAMLEYYDEIGHKDWSHAVTGAAMLKVQHPEFETYYGGSAPSRMAAQGYGCSDCHMTTKQAEDGTIYSSHYWVSPLENETLMNTTCNAGGGCHTDIKSQVLAWQDASETRVHAIAAKIGELIEKIGEQISINEDGEVLLNDDATIDQSKLEKAQRAHRVAQFYWDFVMVENSEGVHNVALADETLDKAEEAVAGGLALFA